MKKLYFLCLSILISTASFAQGFETFANSPLGSSYAAGNFVGDNSVTWNYVESRNANNDANNSGITLPAIMLRAESYGSLVSAMSGANGVGGITMKLYKGFSSSILRQVDVYVNGTYYGTSVGFNDAAAHVFTITGINETGNVLIEIKNTKSVQIIVDDISWSASGQVLSVKDNQIEGFSMYPNPVTKGNLTISSNNGLEKQVAIYSMLGKRVFYKNVNANETINVSNLVRGFYLVKVQEGDKMSTKKLLIK